ncbi:hypothetical protein ACFWPQ_31385 [Streptomyces sp. NPDC058464]
MSGRRARPGVEAPFFLGTDADSADTPWPRHAGRSDSTYHWNA